MLAAMKLGAVVIPASTLLTPIDLQDRFARGRVRHVITSAADAPKFDGLDPSVTRIAVGGAPGWIAYETLLHGPARKYAPTDRHYAAGSAVCEITSASGIGKESVASIGRLVFELCEALIDR